jgi:hypothetical protein
MGAVIADWQLPISELCLTIGQLAIGNRKLAMSEPIRYRGRY